MRYCDECKKETRWLTVPQAAEVVGRSERTIYYWIEHRLVHARQLPSGYGTRVCENCLLKKLEENE
jgi:predicted DNA-binding transcriptional regulator AlpA